MICNYFMSIKRYIWTSHIGEELHWRHVLSCRSWSLIASGPLGPSTVIFVAVDGPQANYDCHRWSTFATSGPQYFQSSTIIITIE